MKRTKFYVCGMAGLLLAVLVLGCGDSTSPVSPSGAANGGSGGALPDGSTLKYSVPSPISPSGGVRLDNRRPTLVASNSQARFLIPGVGAPSLEFQLLNSSGNAVGASPLLAQGSGSTSFTWPVDLDRDTAYNWRVRAVLDGRVTAWSSNAGFITQLEARTPDPPPGQRLPEVNGSWAVFQIAGQFPGALRNSCQDHGGTWEFMDRVIDLLRTTDTRWGYNCKRKNCPDWSLDAINYHFGPGPDEGSDDNYTFDIIEQHCGPNPAPRWASVTDFSGPGARWTGRFRF